MSGQNVLIPHKTRFSNCKGTLLEDKAAYGTWAHWNYMRGGWQSTPVSLADMTAWKDKVVNRKGIPQDRKLDAAVEWFNKEVA